MPETKHLAALVVGGPGSFVTTNAAPVLAEYGLIATWHMQGDKPSRQADAIPAGCQAVVCFPGLTMKGGIVSKSLREAAKRRGIPFVSTNNRGSIIKHDLERAGFRPLNQQPRAIIEHPKAPHVTKITPPHAVPAPPLVQGISEVMPPAPLPEPTILESSETGITTEIVRITPEMAMNWLIKCNVKNRPMYRSLVQKYAAMMRAGQWHVTHQGIAFGEENVLYDGQNRLEAIMEAGVPVDMMVTRGLKSFTRPGIDNGRSRTIADNYAIMSTDDSKDVKRQVSVATALHTLIEGPNVKEGSTYYAVTGLLETFKTDIIWAVENVPKSGFGNALVLAAIAFARKANPTLVEDFAHRLVTGIGLVEGAPVLAVREHLLHRKIPSSAGERRDLIVKILGGIASHIIGKKLLRLQTTETAAVFFAQAHGLEVWLREEVSEDALRAYRKRTTAEDQL
jgi:hypothetical protein